MKKVLALLLALALVVGLIPLAAAAEDVHSHEGWTEIKDTTEEKYFSSLNGSNYQLKTGNATNLAVRDFPEGNYYLGSDVELNCPIIIRGTVNLCLNGHAINLVADTTWGHGLIIVLPEGTLNLFDEGQGSHRYYVNRDGCLIDVNGVGTTGTFSGGYITGGACWSASQSTALASGDEVDFGVSTFGGAICVVGGTLNMHGGAICGNSGETGGGVSMRNSATFNLYNGTICGNRADNGGGVAVLNGGKFTMEGGVIESNTALTAVQDGADGQVITGGLGGGVYLEGGYQNGTQCLFTMNDGTLRANKAGRAGGGIFGNLYQRIRLNKGLIQGNQAVSDSVCTFGGGVLSLGTLRMEYDGETDFQIQDNTARIGGGVSLAWWPYGEVYYSDAGITGGTISGNHATLGRGIYVGGGIPWSVISSVDAPQGLAPIPAAGVFLGNDPVLEEVYLGAAVSAEEAALVNCEEVSAALISDCRLAASARIAVNTTEKPTADHPVTIVKTGEGWNAFSLANYSSVDRAYVVKKGEDERGNDVLQLVVNNTPYYPVSAYNIKVLPADNGAARASKSTAQRGETVTVTGEGAEGYKLLDVDVRDSQNKPVDAARQENGSFTFTMPADNVTVQPTFADADFVDAVYCDMGEECPLVDYIDVFADRWYHHGVHFMLKKGFMTGTDTDMFSPNAVTSRAMAITVLWRMAGSPVVDYAMPFTDVAEGKWYTEAVRWGASQGIISGHKGTTLYCPDDPVTREQMAVILYYAGKATGFDLSLGDETEPLPFQDQNRISFYARTAVRWAYHHEILYGREDGLLAPKQGTTRAELAQFLYRLFPRGYLANK